MPSEAFSVSRPIPGVFHIRDILGVHATLIVGRHNALLVDTGSGLGDLSAVVGNLTGLPLTVVNTHGHQDHIGGNYQFDRVLLSKRDFVLARFNTGLTVKERVLGLLPPAEIPASFDLAGYMGYGLENVEPLREGTTFDLGGERITAIPLPNHTPGSIGFLCLEKRVLLAGDSVAPFMSLFFPEACSLNQHTQILDGVLADPRFDRMLCAHSESVFVKKDARLFRDCAAAAARHRGRSYHDSVFPEYKGLKYTHFSDENAADCAAIVYNPQKIN